MEQHIVLNSTYVIDGVRQDSSPASMLDECRVEMRTGGRKANIPSPGEITDESLERTVVCPIIYNKEEIVRYSEAVDNIIDRERRFPLAFPEQFSRQRVARALLDCIWSEGDFDLRDLQLRLEWKWNSQKMGAMSSFYASCAAVADYLYDLDCCVESYSFSDDNEDCGLICEVCTDEEKNIFPQKRICPEKCEGEDSDWIIYIPFDTCKFRLGASLLAEAVGDNGELAPETGDPDWFMDCFEVVRELVYDGVVTSGTTVCDGGLQAAVRRICDHGEFNISGLSGSYGEKDSVRMLFAEVPGVLIRIRDIDYDYVDSQLLLQDIAYYPLGHPSANGNGISLTDNSCSKLSNIISSLLVQASEGED